MSTSLAVARPEPQPTTTGCTHCHDGLLVALQAEKIGGLLQQLEHTEREPQTPSPVRTRLEEPTIHRASFVPLGKDGKLIHAETVHAGLVADSREATIEIDIGQAHRHANIAMQLAPGGWLIEVTRIAFLRQYNHSIIVERSGRAVGRMLSRRHQAVHRLTPRGMLLVGSGEDAGFDLHTPWRARRNKSDVILQLTYRAEAQTSLFVSEALRGVGLRRLRS